MESAFLSAARDDRLRAFALPAVSRAAAILADLRYFGVAPEPIRAGASARYFARVQHVADEMPAQLVAHAYVHYMADVSGAMIAGRVAQRGFNLASRGGTAFLSFPAVPAREVFREDFRRRLDGFPLDAFEMVAVVEEAVVAFELNRGLADELWEAPLASANE